MMIQIAATAAAGIAALYVALERYRKTSHGDNPWTLEAFLNVVNLHRHYERAAELVDGTITSVFRSERVNKLAKGVETSRHLRALAVDIKPRMLSPKEAMTKLIAAAHRGELGPVRKVLEEPTVVHVEYAASGEPATLATAGYWEPPKDRVSV